ncbi:hypothetical protein [Romboutsia sp. 1001285H_161024_C4]|uniref:hypothetical protein n=1 Tax=Romboutsia sp. 1001285H_161024_C4 TaxID=2787109 RepID=UPI001898F128|nr:hypothetical protein [Romboutsia sp. 1001285H_161024_C4]
MSIFGMEQEIEWVKNKLKNLRIEVDEIDNYDLTSAFEEFDSSLDDLIEECEDTISSVRDL